MTKLNYIAKLDGQIIGTRSSASARVYTHAVVIQRSEDWYRERAESTANAAARATKREFAYQVDRAARGIEGEMAEYKYTPREECERRVVEAQRIVALGYEGWVEEQRQKNIADHAAAVARNGFRPAVVCWNGRPDLARKETAKWQGNPGIASVWIVEAERVEKLPKIKGEKKHAAYGPHAN